MKSRRRSVFSHRSSEQRQTGKVFSTVFFADLGLAAISAFPMVLVAVFCNSLFDVPVSIVGEVRAFLLLMLGSVEIEMVSGVFGAAYLTSGRLDLRAAADMITVACKGMLLWAFFCGAFRFSILGIGGAVFLSSMFGALLRFLLSRYLAPTLTVSPRDFSGKVLRRMVASGVRYSLYELGSFLLGGAFLPLVNITLGGEAAGIYSVATTVLRAFGGILLIFTGVLSPAAAKRYAINGSGNGEEVIKDQKTVGFFTSVAVAMAVGYLGEFFALWLGETDTPLLRAVTVLAILPILSAAGTLPVFHLAVATDRLGKIALFEVGGAIFAIGGAVALAGFTDAGILGVAAVSFAARTLWYAGVMPLFAGKLCGCDPRRFYPAILRTYLGCALSAGLILLLRSVAPISSWGDLFLIASVSPLSVVAISHVAVFGFDGTFLKKPEKG